MRIAESNISLNANGLITEEIPVNTVLYVYHDGRLTAKKIVPASGNA